jgi:PAS domain-containing protein
MISRRGWQYPFSPLGSRLPTLDSRRASARCAILPKWSTISVQDLSDSPTPRWARDFPALLALTRLPVPILAVDDAGEIVFANEAFAAMLGYSRPALVSMTVQSLIACIPPPNSDVVSALREYANSVMRLPTPTGGPCRPWSAIQC